MTPVEPHIRFAFNLFDLRLGQGQNRRVVPCDESSEVNGLVLESHGNVVERVAFRDEAAPVHFHEHDPAENPGPLVRIPEGVIEDQAMGQGSGLRGQRGVGVFPKG